MEAKSEEENCQKARRKKEFWKEINCCCGDDELNDWTIIIHVLKENSKNLIRGCASRHSSAAGKVVEALINPTCRIHLRTVN